MTQDGSADDRIARIERLMAQSVRLQASFQEAQAVMQRNMRQIEANNREIEANNRLIDQRLAEQDEMLQHLLQAVTLLQADIIRIDETRG